jgi:hypothetical protein
MVRNYFHLVPRVLESGFYCDVSRDEIERYLYKEGEFDRSFTVPVVDENGDDAEVNIRLILQRNGSRLNQLSVALLLHDTRIGGIDWEGRFQDCDGKRRSGWHRHVWDERVRNAESRKIALDDFESSFTDVRGFLMRAVEELKIALSGKDYGDPEQQSMQWT